MLQSVCSMFSKWSYLQFSVFPILAILANPPQLTAGDDDHHGHAGDVFVGVKAGHIFTGMVDDDQVEEGVRMFESEFGESGVPGFTDEPGWEAFPGTFDPNIRVGWNALTGVHRWNGDGFDDLIDETITVSFGSLSFEIGASAVDGFDLAVQPDGGLHRHIGFLLENPFGDPEVGVYLVQLELYSSTGTPESSEPFWIVFNNEADEEEHEAAAEWVEEHLVGEEHCHGDINGDHEVNVEDLLQLLSNWGECDGCASDIDEDGFVTVLDLLEMISEWGECH